MCFIIFSLRLLDTPVEPVKDDIADVAEGLAAEESPEVVESQTPEQTLAEAGGSLKTFLTALLSRTAAVKETIGALTDISLVTFQQFASVLSGVAHQFEDIVCLLAASTSSLRVSPEYSADSGSAVDSGQPQTDAKVDHVKHKRLPRTTLSCLNCHTSKRKCDRKRPCARCIQLGLTGLCVYEVEDPAARDDPNVDETTRLRNRIMELESLVRELRGKPHPRWANHNSQDAKRSKERYSRSTRQGTQSTADITKQEQGADTSPSSGSQLYRMSPSPAPQLGFDGAPCGAGGDLQYSPSSLSSSSTSYPNTLQSSQSISASEVPYRQSYDMRSPGAADSASCTCLTNPAAGAPLISLTHQLQNTVELLRQLPEHAARHNCTILRRIAQLNDLMHGGTGESTLPTPFDGLSTPDSELISPVAIRSLESVA